MKDIVFAVLMIYNNVDRSAGWTVSGVMTMAQCEAVAAEITKQTDSSIFIRRPQVVICKDVDNK